MRTFKTLAVIFVLFAAITSLHADERIKIRIKQPPPNMLGVGDMWNLTLENTTKTDLKIYLTGTATEEKDGLIIEGKSKVFTVKPGRTNYTYNDFSGAEVKYNNGKYKEVILRTGNAPEGSYTICVTAFEESGEIAGMENCITQTVQQLGSITLISPENGAELDPDTLPGLVFSWTPLPNGGPYSLRIVELKGDQSPEVAFRTNPPIFEKEYKSTTTQGDPIHGVDVKLGMKFAWQVSCGDVVSEVFAFGKIKETTRQHEIVKEKAKEEDLSRLKNFPEVEEALKLLESDCEYLDEKSAVKYYMKEDNNSWAIFFEIKTKCSTQKPSAKYLIFSKNDDSLFVMYTNSIDEISKGWGGSVTGTNSAAGDWGSWYFYAYECRRMFPFCSWNKKVLVLVERRDRHHWLWGNQSQYRRSYYSCGSC